MEGLQLPWAVRGEVPLEDERSACGCTVVVFGGVRMQLPDKVFGRNWLEMHHAASGVMLSFDCISALQRWAQLSLLLIDEARSGQASWSGRTCDVEELRSVWQASEWASSTHFSRREEWDWSYRCDYAGRTTKHFDSQKVGTCARRVQAVHDHALIRVRRQHLLEDTEDEEQLWLACAVTDGISVDGLGWERLLAGAAGAKKAKSAVEAASVMSGDYLSGLGGADGGVDGVNGVNGVGEGARGESDEVPQPGALGPDAEQALFEEEPLLERRLRTDPARSRQTPPELARSQQSSPDLIKSHQIPLAV